MTEYVINTLVFLFALKTSIIFTCTYSAKALGDATCVGDQCVVWEIPFLSLVVFLDTFAESARMPFYQSDRCLVSVM